MTRQILFNGVGPAATQHKTKLLHAFSRVIDSGILLEGKENRALATNLMRRLEKGCIIPVASGHDALLLSLLALKLKPTDEVVFPVNSYPTAFPVVLSGATPIPVDIDKNGQLDPASVEKAITKHTRVMVMVHLFGLVGNLLAMINMCRKHKLILIEDAAQAFGTTYRSKHVGTLGDIGCFSFYPTKNLGALGEGGAIWTKNRRIASFLTQAKMYGEKNRYHSRFVAGHSRLPELQAAGLRVYLKNIDRIKTKRKRIVGWYTDELSKGSFSKFLRIIQSVAESDPMPHVFVIVCNKRDKLQKYLTKHKIPTAIQYPLPIHRVKAFSSVDNKHKDFPVAEILAKHILSLPFHEYLTRNDVRHIVCTIHSFYEKDTG